MDLIQALSVFAQKARDAKQPFRFADETLDGVLSKSTLSRIAGMFGADILDSAKVHSEAIFGEKKPEIESLAMEEALKDYAFLKVATEYGDVFVVWGIMPQDFNNALTNAKNIAQRCER